MDPKIKESIDSLINQHQVILFMKGTKNQPQCGFSNQVVSMLGQLVPDFFCVNVLADENIREGIKEFSSWPTIPQLYINKEFVGGCDIVTDLYKNGQLSQILGIKKAENAPNIELSPSALVALNGAFKDSKENEAIRISISANFEHGLTFDEKKPDDFVINFDGLLIIMDPFGATRANNLQIDYIEDALESGFSFNNPNEPESVKDLDVEELAKWHQQNQDFTLIDVRPKKEWEQAHITFAKRLDAMTKKEIDELKKDHALVFHCHHGGRSRVEAESFRFNGFNNVYNLVGGIDAWSRKVDQKVSVYN